MPLSPPPCDPRRATRFLDGALSDVEQAAFETHLESCSTCRAALESTAGDAQAWSQVRDYLSSVGSHEDLTRDAANEQAVQAFHAGRIGYLDILATVEAVVDAHTVDGELTRGSLAEAEAWARRTADERIAAA